MKIQEGFLGIKGNKLRCLRMGQGHKLMIAFHGFAQNAENYEPLAKLLADDYTLIAFDFPGDSRALWTGDKMPDNKTMWVLIDKLQSDFAVEKVTLTGFSMGGRMAMCLAEYYPEKTEQLILLASDGLKKNVWYRLATREFYGRLIFKRILNNPDWWLRKINFLMDKGIVSSRWRNLVNNTLRDNNYREKIGRDWFFTKNFIPSPRHLGYAVLKLKFPVHVFMGQYDSIFPISEGQNFVEGLPSAKLHIMPVGHQLLGADSLPDIANIIREEA